MIITHADDDHINGLSELIELSDKTGEVKIRNLILPETALRDEIYISFLEKAKEKDINIYYISTGNEINFNRLKLTCLHPYKGYLCEDRNEYSTCLSLSYGDFDCLLTGDICGEGEECFINNLKDYIKEKSIHYELLKVAHHGSRFSTPYELLDLIHNDYSIISCGLNNRYSHPHKETLERLSSVGSQVYRTDQKGCITIIIEDNKIDINPFLREKK
jgi:competence protein ComEC